MTEEYYDQTAVLQGIPGKQIEIEKLIITTDTASSVIIADDNPGKPTSKKLYLNVGLNSLCHWALVFIQGRKVTITPSAANTTIFVRYNYK